MPLPLILLIMSGVWLQGCGMKSKVGNLYWYCDEYDTPFEADAGRVKQ